MGDKASQKLSWKEKEKKSITTSTMLISALKSYQFNDAKINFIDTNKEVQDKGI